MVYAKKIEFNSDKIFSGNFNKGNEEELEISVEYSLNGNEKIEKMKQKMKIVNKRSKK